MRLPARLIAITAVAGVLTGGLVAWTSSAGPSGGSVRAEIAAPGSRAHRTPPASASPSPAIPPAIRVVGAPGGVRAKGAVVADASTGQVLWSRDFTAPRPMASVTKVMTALLVINAGNLDRLIKVPKSVLGYVWKFGASSASLHPGDVLTARELLNGLMLPSGADAAYVLANAYGPGLPAFISRMNATAAQMGLSHTHFTSPDGLPYPTETATFSTPADLLKLGLTAMKSSLFRSIVDQRFYRLPKGKGHNYYWWGNTNELIGTYQGAVGIKTGYTVVAGHCLMFEAVRHGRTLIGVVLGSPPTGPSAGADDAARMLNWAFALPHS